MAKKHCRRDVFRFRDWDIAQLDVLVRAIPLNSKRPGCWILSGKASVGGTSNLKQYLQHTANEPLRITLAR